MFDNNLTVPLRRNRTTRYYPATREIRAKHSPTAGPLVTDRPLEGPHKASSYWKKSEQVYSRGGAGAGAPPPTEIIVNMSVEFQIIEWYSLKKILGFEVTSK